MNSRVCAFSVNVIRIEREKEKRNSSRKKNSFVKGLCVHHKHISKHKSIEE